MVRYFFHTESGSSFIDREGTEFSDAQGAKIEAVRMLGELLKAQAEEFWNVQELKVIVTDATGLVLFQLEVEATEAPALSGYGKRR